MVATARSVSKMAAASKSVPKMAASTVFLVNFITRRLVSSLVDSPLVSMRAASVPSPVLSSSVVPVVAEVCPLSSVLRVFAMALWSVPCSSVPQEVSQAHELESPEPPATTKMAAAMPEAAAEMAAAIPGPQSNLSPLSFLSQPSWLRLSSLNFLS